MTYEEALKQIAEYTYGSYNPDEYYGIGVHEEAARLYARECVQEPSEEEISHAWSEWYKENGGNNTQESWESAITWFKQQINR